MARRLQIFLVGSFSLILMLPHLFYLGFFSNKGEVENLSFLEDYEMNSLQALKTDFDAYYQENHGGHEVFVRAYSHLQFKVLKSSPLPYFSVLGKDNWLFLGNYFQQVLAEHRGVLRLQPREIEALVTQFESNQRWAQARGMKYYLAVAPNKHTVYNEYLPVHYQNAGETKLDQVKSRFKQQGLFVIDLKEYYQKHDSLRFFHKTDSHWNQVGAFLGYQKLIHVIQQDFKTLRPLELHQFELDTAIRYDMDIARMLKIRLREEVLELKPNKGVFKAISQPKQLAIPEHYKYNPKEYEIRFKGEGNLKVLVLRDSFGNDLLPFLKEGFKESVFIWEHQFKQELILKENPDIIVQEIAERAL